MKDLDKLRKKIKRLQKSQEEAEFYLEKKSRELYDLNQSLEQQVIERTKEFEVAKETAENANKAKSQFLANMSHEIRTPLNGMLGFIGLLEKSQLNETQKEQLGVVSKSGNLLLNIINDILEFSKIEAGKLEIDSAEFHLKRCVEDIVDVMANQVYEKKLELPVYLDERIPKNLVGDEARLRQVLVNLVGNAVKFTPSGEISVKVESLEVNEKGEYLTYFEVKDTGVGISKDKLNSIFSAFEQADVSDTRKYGGTGLGLTISRQIVAAMGGELSVESEESVGTKFFFTIPLAAPEEGQVEFSDRTFNNEEEAILLVNNKTMKENLIKRLKSWDIAAQGSQQVTELQWQLSKNKNLILDSLFFNEAIKSGEVEYWLEKGAHLMVLASPIEKSALSEKSLDPRIDIITKPIKREVLFNSISEKGQLKEEAEEKEAPTNSAANGKHLLLVEDNMVNQQVALAMLEVHGYTADIANNGQEAIDLFDPSKYGLILMDCQMPVMDGFDATKGIKSKYPEVKIIAMTANAFKKTKEQCFEVGMDDFVTKPIGDEDLASVIKKHLLEAA